MTSRDDQLLEYPESSVEIDGRITYQIMELMPQGEYDELGKTISVLGFDVHHKLNAMVYHRDRYIASEEGYLSKCIEMQMDSARIPASLLFEFEAFLFQTKSCLDIAVNLLDHLFPDSFRTHTFQNKGKKLVDNLQKYADRFEKETRDNGSSHNAELAISFHRDTVSSLITLLEDEKARWLSDAIETRDTISHYKGSFSIATYTIERTEKQAIITPPSILGVYPRDFMNTTYNNCITFLQEFFCLFVELWLPPPFAIRLADPDQGGV